MDDHVSISTPDHVALDFELAGLGSRFTAMVLDVLLLIAVMIVLRIAMMFAGPAVFFVDFTNGSVAVAAFIIIMFVITWGYFVFFETVMKGQTPGKKGVGIRVIRDDGLPISLREAAIRNLVRFGDTMPPIQFLIGGIVASADKRGRRLGDMAAGTVVVRERYVLTTDFGTGASWAARVERGQSRHAITLPKGSITAQQLGLIEQFLARRLSLPADRRAAIAWQIAEPLLDAVGADRRAIAVSMTRGPTCEQILLEVVSMARQPSGATASSAALYAQPVQNQNRPSLF